MKNKFKGNVLQGGYLRLGPPEIRKVPIPVSELKGEKKQKQIIELVDKITQLIDLLYSTTENSEKWKTIKVEITNIDKKIDEEVYKLYSLTPEEIKIVERDK